MVPMDDRDALLSYINAVAPSVGLSILPEHLESVAQALAGLLEQGALLLSFPLDEAIAPASHYTP